MNKSDLVTIALGRKLAAAEKSGDEALAERLRARLAPAPVAPRAAPPAPTPAEEPVGPSFASPQAEDLAKGHGLGPDDFDFEASGKHGYTVADVRRAAGLNDEEED